MNMYADKMKELGGYYVGGAERRPLGSEGLKQIEKQLGDNLPVDYASFLSAYGGFAFDSSVTFPIQNYSGGDTGLLDVFFGALPQPNDPYDLVYRLEMYESRIPSRLLPIATDPGGNMICLSLTGDDVGTVYFWDHEEEGEPPGVGQQLGESNLYLIAHSFDHFIQSLTKQET